MAKSGYKLVGEGLNIFKGDKINPFVKEVKDVGKAGGQKERVRKPVIKSRKKRRKS